MAIKVDRSNGQNYAENLVEQLLLFDSDTWTIASGTGTATLDADNVFAGDSSLKIENNVPLSPITATNSDQDTTAPINGEYQISWYIKKNAALEIINGSVLIYKNSILIDTQSYSIGSDIADLPLNEFDVWVRYQSDVNYIFDKDDVITFQFRIDSSETIALSTFIYVDGVMLNLAGRDNVIVPDYVLPNITSNNPIQSTQYIADLVNPSYSEGLVFYDTTKKSLSYYNDERDTTINVGQELVGKVYNNNGSTITNGTPVRLDGSTVGGVPTIIRSIADTVLNAGVIGVATHDIAVNETGYITQWGEIGDYDTSGFTSGDFLYVSATVAGELTNIEQPILKPVAIVLTSDISGSILVAQRPVLNITALGQASGQNRTQSVTTTPQVITAYEAGVFEKNTIVTTAGTTNLSANISPVSLGASGFYRVTFNIAMTTSSNELYTFEAYINGTPTGVLCVVDLNNNNIDAGSGSINAITQQTINDSDLIEIYAYADGGTNAVTYTSVTFNIERIGSA